MDSAIWQRDDFSEFSRKLYEVSAAFVSNAIGGMEAMAKLDYARLYGELNGQSAAYAALKNEMDYVDGAIGNVFLGTIAIVNADFPKGLPGLIFASKSKKQRLANYEAVISEVHGLFEDIEGRYDWNQFIADKAHFERATRR